jgi:hypothetical protein
MRIFADFHEKFVYLENFVKIDAKFTRIFWGFLTSYNSVSRYMSRTSNIAFLMDLAETVNLDFGLIHQNISIKKASFHY